MASSSVYDVMTSWFTPSFLFIFINLVIAIIAITSRFASKRQPQQQLVRPPSMLHRLMSFNISSYYCPQEPFLNHDSPRFDRVPSSSFFERVRSFNLSFRREAPQPDPVEPAQQQLSRPSSLVERIKSIKFYRSESTKVDEKECQPEPKPEPELKSESKPEPEPESDPEPEYKNTGSGCLEDENDEEGEAVDAKADDFINRFKQQLRLQRLDSIIRYRDMLRRY